MAGEGTAAGDTGRYRTLHGRRRGKRLRPRQQSLLGSALPGLRIVLPHAPRLEPDGTITSPPVLLDPATLFGDKAPRQVWLEVGFGAGEHLIWQARANPEVGLIGCEPFVQGMARCLAQIEREGVQNVRLFDDDARLLLASLVPDSLDRVFILFPDPWPKLRHHKRRLVRRETLDLLARLMRPDAELRLATDDPGYLSWMVEHACLHPAFTWLAEHPADWRERPADWPPTRYERKMLAGRKPAFLRLRRK
jgi:tRNA (guanine-N7-)-methyltransferase